MKTQIENSLIEKAKKMFLKDSVTDFDTLCEKFIADHPHVEQDTLCYCLTEAHEWACEYIDFLNK